MDKNVYLAIIVALVLLCSGCVNLPKAGNETKKSGDVSKEVEGLFKAPPKEYMVAYETTVVTDKEQAKLTNAIYYRGETQMRMDSFIGEIESRMFINKNEFIQCTKQGGVWGCLLMEDKESTTQESTVERDTEELEKNIAEEKATRIADRVIAGVTCKCFYMKISFNMPGAKDTGMSDLESTHCVSPEGIPLYVESKTSAMHSIRQATKYLTKLSDADFVPPAKPGTMEEYLTGGSGTETTETMPENVFEPSEENCNACDNMPTEEAKQECRDMFKCG